MREALTQDHFPYIGKLNPGCSSRTSAVTSGPSYDNVQMLEDDEGLKFTVTQAGYATENYRAHILRKFLYYY